MDTNLHYQEGRAAGYRCGEWDRDNAPTQVPAVLLEMGERLDVQRDQAKANAWIAETAIVRGKSGLFERRRAQASRSEWAWLLGFLREYRHSTSETYTHARGFAL